jgi:hypothetical protein
MMMSRARVVTMPAVAVTRGTTRAPLVLVMMTPKGMRAKTTTAGRENAGA